MAMIRRLFQDLTHGSHSLALKKRRASPIAVTVKMDGIICTKKIDILSCYRTWSFAMGKTNLWAMTI
jgi:hypothetical protein